MDALPFVTVVIPALNEAATIEQMLRAVLTQDYPQDRYEVIITDGLSNDGTREIVGPYIAQHSLQAPHVGQPVVRLLDNPGRIVSTGLNQAILQAKGEIIVRVDAHTIIEPDYVRQCVLALESTGADGVGGSMTAVGHGYVAEAIARATATPFAIGNSAYRTSRFLRERYAETTHMGAYRKETLLRIGLFNEHLVRHQDYELDYRIRRGGGTIFLSPHIRSRYYVRGSLRRLWRQYFQYGFWKGRFLRENPRSLRARHTIPPAFVLFLLLAGALSLFGYKWTWQALSATLVLYGLFLAFGTSYALRFRGRAEARPAPAWRTISLLPVILAIVHSSWGLGVWLGLLTPEALTPMRWPR